MAELAVDGLSVALNGRAVVREAGVLASRRRRAGGRERRRQTSQVVLQSVIESNPKL